MSNNGVQAKVRPSRWFYAIGAAVIILGPALFGLLSSSSMFMNVNSLLPSIQVVAPGKSNITLPASGEYTIFYEFQSVIGSKVYDTGRNIPVIQVNLSSQDTGSAIPLSTSFVEKTYSSGSRSGIGIFDFTVDRPGIYEISTLYHPLQEQKPEIVLSIFQGSFVNAILGEIGRIAAIVFGLFAAGVAIIIITYLKRRKAKKTRTLA
jgi:hypothetical protein